MIESLHPFGVRIDELSLLPSVAQLLDLVREHKLVVVRRSAPLSRDEFLSYCRAANPESDPCLHWDFGPVMELKVDPSSKNYLFSREAVPFHWDGAFHLVPSVLVFNCIVAPNSESGGQTLFSDTERMFEVLPQELKTAGESAVLTYTTRKVAHYGGSFSTKLFQQHPKKVVPIVRFAEEVNTALNPVSLQVDGVRPQRAGVLVDYLSRRLYESDVCYEHRWQNGDLVLADNYSLVHGRRAFSAESPRHIRRIQLV